MNLKTINGCCTIDGGDNTPPDGELYGPFIKRDSTKHTRQKYHYYTWAVWPDAKPDGSYVSVNHDNSYTVDGWKVDSAELEARFTTITLSPHDARNLCWGVRHVGTYEVEDFGESEPSNVDYSLFLYNADDRQLRFETDVTATSVVGSYEVWIFDFVPDSMYSTWLMAEDRHPIIEDTAMPLSGHGNVAEYVYYSAFLNDQWACNSSTLAFVQPIWGSTPLFDVLTEVDTDGTLTHYTNSISYSALESELELVAAGATSSGATPDRGARLQICCPRSYPNCFGVKPAAQWFYAGSPPYTSHEEAVIVFGNIDNTQVGIVDVVDTVYTASQTRTAYVNTDARRLNAKALYGDSYLEGNSTRAWACALYWGREEVDSSGNLSDDESQLLVRYRYAEGAVSTLREINLRANYSTTAYSVMAYSPNEYVTLEPANYSAASTYAVGDLVTSAGQVYQCAVAVTTPETFDYEKWTLLGSRYDVWQSNTTTNASAFVASEWDRAPRYVQHPEDAWCDLTFVYNPDWIADWTSPDGMVAGFEGRPDYNRPDQKIVWRLWLYDLARGEPVWFADSISFDLSRGASAVRPHIVGTNQSYLYVQNWNPRYSSASPDPLNYRIAWRDGAVDAQAAHDAGATGAYELSDPSRYRLWTSRAEDPPTYNYDTPLIERGYKVDTIKNTETTGDATSVCH